MLSLAIFHKLAASLAQPNHFLLDFAFVRLKSVSLSRGLSPLLNHLGNHNIDITDGAGQGLGEGDREQPDRLPLSHKETGSLN